MIEFSTVLTMLAMIFPGAAGYRTFLYVAHHPPVSRVELMSMGAFLSVVAYGLLAVCGWLDLTLVLDTESDQLSARSLLETENVVTVLLITAGSVVVGLACGRFARSGMGERIAVRLLGRTIEGNDRVALAEDLVGRVVSIHHESGMILRGVAVSITTSEKDGFVRIGAPESLGPNQRWESWRESWATGQSSSSPPPPPDP